MDQQSVSNTEWNENISEQWLRTGNTIQYYNLMKNHHTKIDLDEVDIFIYRLNIEHRATKFV